MTNIQDVIVDFINNPSDKNFADAIAALTEFREYHKKKQTESIKTKPAAKPPETPKAAKDKNAVVVNFSTPEKEKQFKIISKHLIEMGVTVELYRNTETITCWKLTWDGDRAMLYMCADWEIGSGKYGEKPKGKFEGFNLLDNLVDNGIDITDW